MSRPSLKRKMPPIAVADLGTSFHPSVTSMPLIRCTIRSPARKMQLVERNLGSIIEPRVPVQRFRRKIERRWILPRARRIVSSQRKFHHFDVADCSARVKFSRLRAKHGTNALRANLHDAIIFLRSLDHGQSVGYVMRHRLLAIDILSPVAPVDHTPRVPINRTRRYDAVDILAIEQLPIMTRSRKARVGGDLFGQGVASVIQVGGADALHARNRNRPTQQAGTLHPDSDHAKANPITGCHRSRQWLSFASDR